MKPARLIAMMCLAEVLGMLGFFTFPALLPTFIQDWQLTNTDAGWINSAFFFGYMTTVPVLVSLTDRVDSKRIYLGCMAISALSVCGFAFGATGFWSALLYRTLGGIGLAGTYMPGLKALSDLIEGPAQSRAVSFYTSSFGIGSALSFYMSGKIAIWADWQTAFAVAGIGPVLALLIVWRLLPPVPPAHMEDRGTHVGDFVRALKNRRAMGYTLAYMVHNFELFGFRSWLVVFLTVNQTLQPGGGSPIAPATFAALLTLLALPSSVSGNELAVRFGRRKVVCIVMSASALMAWVLGSSVNLPFALVAPIAVLYGVLVMADSSPITAGTVGQAAPGLRGTTMAVHACVGFIGSFLGPLVFGMVLDASGGSNVLSSWALAFGTMGAVVALGPVFVLWLSREPRLTEDALPGTTTQTGAEQKG